MRRQSDLTATTGAVKEPRDYLLHYADGRGVARYRKVTLHRVDIRRGSVQLAGYCHLRRQPRTFALAGVLDIADPHTGEVLPIVETLVEAAHLPRGEIERAVAATETRRRRTIELGPHFDGEGVPIGWAFGVPAAFRAALDIQLLVYKEGGRLVRYWTRGHPPALSFSVGDVFYEPAEVRGLPWGEALLSLSRCARVTAATPDGAATQGRVTFQLAIYSSGRRVAERAIHCSQAAFETFLRTGDLPSETP